MTEIKLERGAVSVDAETIAVGLGMRDAASVQRLMRAGTLTSLCERGVDEDAGRHRVTFFYKNRRLRLVIDENGKVIERSVAESSVHLPRTAVRPSPR